MQKVWKITLTNSKDTEISYVNEDVWNWVISDDMGKGMAIGRNEGFWKDQLVPQWIKDNWERWHGEPYDPIFITRGSWQNDRAICAIDVGLDWSKIDEDDLRNSLAAQGYELQNDRYEGYIY